jgi:hypothetical protein
MTKRGLASSAVAFALLLSRAASAQPQLTAGADAPQWLKDRRYNEGIGIRTGDLELHPGIAGEVGYDSNYFLRSDKTGANIENAAPNAPVISAAAFRITPSLYLSTLGAQRREGDYTTPQPSVAFRAGVNATYRAFVGLSNNQSGNQNNDITQQDNLGGAADARVDILPGRPFGADLFATYARVIMPNIATANPDLSFTRDDVGVGGELVVTPGSGTLDWHLGYQFHDAIFETSAGQPYDNYTHEAFTRGRWRFRPRTALIYDASLRFNQYVNTTSAANAGLTNSDPVRARIGLNGLITDRFAALAMVGWGATFLDQSITPQQPQYDSVIGQAELKWFLAASPGIAAASDVGLTLSSIALGYTRDFQQSYLASYYGSDRGYLKFAYFFAGRALVTVEGGVGAVEYPNMFFGTPGGAIPRANAFTDIRADATLFGEYRVVSTVGINATLRYTANFSNTEILANPPPSTTLLDMSWNRFEAYLGVRWFM